MPRPMNVPSVGKRFGRVVITGRKWNGKRNLATYLCDCGTRGATDPSNLRKGHTKSCGCLVRETARKNARRPGWMDAARRALTKHGKANTREYRIYRGMINRCYKRADRGFSRYGGRGIKVCQRWLMDFQNFWDDMGPAPSMRHTLDRINVNGHYEPKNCRWANQKEQGGNTRNTRWVTVPGYGRVCFKQACFILGIDFSAAYKRLYSGMNEQDALAAGRVIRTPIYPSDRPPPPQIGR